MSESRVLDHQSYIKTNNSNTNLKLMNENLEQLYEITKKIGSQTKVPIEL